MPQSAFVAGIPNTQKSQRPPPNHLIPSRPTALPPQVSPQTVVSTQTLKSKGKGKARAAAQSGSTKPATGSAGKAPSPSINRTTPAAGKKAPAASGSVRHAPSTSSVPATNRNAPSTSKNPPATTKRGPSQHKNKPANAPRPPSVTQNPAVATAQQAVAAAEVEAASEDHSHTSGQARAVALMMYENEKLRRELEALRVQQEQSFCSGEDAIEVLTRPSGEAGSRKKGFILIDAMQLNSTRESRQFYNQIQATVRRRIVQANLPPSDKFSSQDPDKIRNIVNLVRHEHRYLCQARFPGGWPVVEMIKLNLRNARKYKRRKNLEFDFDNDFDDEQENAEGSDEDDSSIDPELTTQTTQDEVMLKTGHAMKRKQASAQPGCDEQAEVPTKKARNAPIPVRETRSQSTRRKPLSAVPTFAIPAATRTATGPHVEDSFAAAEAQELDDDPEADEDEEMVGISLSNVVKRTDDGHVIYAPNSDEEDSGDDNAMHSRKSNVLPHGFYDN
ncbi:hypothetical protein EST38_g3828 [Candolleomyces aberdarensis]|uniref:Uncharacterized protein n=1 Tax=Candolleomyces aberdarensis TaxID=2316362 RepID=A0A4Q2DNY1_9AGAR|nr:hypothetical protein EST38_g3828 [Candolleomyces aberdarensis]